MKLFRIICKKCRKKSLMEANTKEEVKQCILCESNNIIVEETGDILE